MYIAKNLSKTILNFCGVLQIKCLINRLMFVQELTLVQVATV